MLHINRGSGFSLTLANGWTVSVQFGPMNYCDKKIRDTQMRSAKEFMHALDAPMNADHWEARTAEISAWFGEVPGNSDDWVFRRYPGERFLGGDIASWDDTVRGWCTADEVVGFVSYIAGLDGAQPAEILDGRCASPWYEIVGQSGM